MENININALLLKTKGLYLRNQNQYDMTIGQKRINRLTEIVKYLELNGLEATAKHFNIKQETVTRERRFYYQYIGKETTDNIRRKPKVLLFDTETSLMQVLSFSIFKSTVPHTHIQVPQHLLCWAGKWLNEAEVFGDRLTSKEAKNHDDERITKSLWDVFESADVILAHNLKRYDRKIANYRFLVNGLKPPSPYNLIDTLEISKKEFRFPSNRLDFLGRMLADDEKIHTTSGLWIDCFNGVEESLENMYVYCKQDVKLLEEVYYELRPWMGSHPNLAVFAEAHEETCSHCASTNLDECGEYVTPSGRFDSLRCVDCGAILRRRKSNLSKCQKDNLLVSTAR